MTISPPLRESLAIAAKHAGMSMSQTAERAIERGRLLGDIEAAGAPVADSLTAMLRAALEVRETAGDPTASIEARDHLRRRWVEIARNALPNVTEQNPARAGARAAVSAMRFAGIDAYGEILEADPDNVRLPAARSHLLDLSTGKLFPGSPTWSQAKADFEAAAKAEGGAVAECLDIILGAASAAERAVARAERSNP